MTEEENTNLDRYQNRLAKLLAKLETEQGDTPYGDMPKAWRRTMDAVEDVLDTDIDNKLRIQMYNGCRATATKYGYKDDLPASGERGAASPIQPTIDAMVAAITLLIRAGLEQAPEVLSFLRRKKNKAGIIYYTEESLIEWLVKSTQKRLEDDHKDNTADNNLTPLLDAYQMHLEAVANSEESEE